MSTTEKGEKRTEESINKRIERKTTSIVKNKQKRTIKYILQTTNNKNTE